MENEKVKQHQTQHSFGKFDSAEELLAAYNALESEFTKRCQLVKELQARINSVSAQADQSSEQSEASADEQLAEQTVPEPIAPEKAQEENVLQQQPSQQTVTAVEQEPSMTEDDVVAEIMAHIEDYAAALAELPQIMNECVARYKKMLLGAEFGVPPVRGAAVLTPVLRPRTLSDAKRLADRLLK